MADISDISDLWWLKPGGGQDNTIGQQWLQGMKFGADQRQESIDNAFKAEHLRNEGIKMKAAAEMALSKQVTDAQKAAGMAEINSHLATVAQNQSWDDPASESEFWRIAGRYPHVIDHNELDNIYKNTFVETRQRNERARQVDQREARLNQAEEDRAAARIQELDIKQQRANDYGYRVLDTKEWHDAQQALNEAKAEKDNTIKQRKLDVAERLATVAEQKANTADMIANARAEFLVKKGKQMERGLGPGEATIFRARFEALRDRYQFPTDPKDKLSTEEFNKQLDILVNEFQGKVKIPQGEPAPAAPPVTKDPLGLFK